MKKNRLQKFGEQRRTNESALYAGFNMFSCSFVAWLYLNYQSYTYANALPAFNETALSYNLQVVDLDEETYNGLVNMFKTGELSVYVQADYGPDYVTMGSRSHKLMVVDKFAKGVGNDPHGYSTVILFMDKELEGLDL